MSKDWKPNHYNQGTLPVFFFAPQKSPCSTMSPNTTLENWLRKKTATTLTPFLDAEP
ncbi:UNVERIFIED_CONTAM: hypothetical protein FKN15_012922 [Acipenser sinensis]